ncbi:MAG: peptidylprolyl isomerase [Planctomycetota bacterium]|jgi:peptidyl-prolyl cis-trans isomerase B (cyclophilin B)
MTDQTKQAGLGGAQHLREPDLGPLDRLYIDYQERRGLYIGGFVVLCIAVLGIMYAADSAGGTRVDNFSPVWTAYAAARDRIVQDQPADEELAQLDRALAEARGTDAEGSALWLSAIAQYGSAWTRDKLAFADREPFLNVARARLEELDSANEQFDRFPPALSRWYTSSTSSPVEEMLERVTTDLEWAKDNAAARPAADEAPTAVLRTDLGDIHLRFYAKLAPKHVANFLKLAQLGSYNGTAFHFVRGGSEPDGVIGGDPFTYFYNDPLNKEHILRWGGGGTGYGIPPEDSRFQVRHSRAIVTAQRRPNADWDNGSQFQILLDTDPALDRTYSPFAVVESGLDVVEKIATRKTAADHGPYKDDPLFQRLDRSGLLVEPAWIRKVIVYGKDGAALEHSFPLSDTEKTLGGLKSGDVQPLEDDALRATRKLRESESEKPYRAGLDFPFPDDITDLKKANAAGDRRELDKIVPGGSEANENEDEKDSTKGGEKDTPPEDEKPEEKKDG